MGGAVSAVTKPVGAAFKGLTGQTGGGGGGSAPAQAPAAAAPERRASRSEEEMGARMRGARRRGRALLADTRLSGEQGVETLGGGGNL